MDRILLMSLVGPAPGGVFGPGMNAGALEAFARERDGKARGGRGDAAGSEGRAMRPAAGATDPRDQRAADAATARFGPATDARCGFLEFLVPH